MEQVDQMRIDEFSLRVRLDVQDPVLLVAEPLSRLLSAEPLDEVDGLDVDLLRELDLFDAAENDGIDLHGTAGSERGTENKGPSQV